MKQQDNFSECCAVEKNIQNESNISHLFSSHSLEPRQRVILLWTDWCGAHFHTSNCTVPVYNV